MCGEKLNAQARLLTAASTMGALKALGENVNLINFSAIAEKLGVNTFYQSVCDPCDFKECIRVRIKGDSPKLVVVIEGTAGEVSMLRKVDGVKLNGGVALSGELIVAAGAADSLPAVVQSVSALGKLRSVVDCGTVYFIGADICTKSTPVPAPLTRWTTVRFY